MSPASDSSCALRDLDGPRDGRALRRMVERRAWDSYANLDELSASRHRLVLSISDPYHRVVCEGDGLQRVFLRCSSDLYNASWFVWITADDGPDGDEVKARLRVSGLNSKDEAVDFGRRLGAALGFAAYRVGEPEDWIEVEVVRQTPEVVGTPFRRRETEESWSPLGAVEDAASYRVAEREPSDFPEAFEREDVESLARWELGDEVVWSEDAVASTEKSAVARAAMSVLAFVLMGTITGLGSMLFFAFLAAVVSAIVSVAVGADYDFRWVAAIPSAMVGLLVGHMFAHMNWTDRGSPAKPSRKLKIRFADRVVEVDVDGKVREHDFEDVRAVRLDEYRKHTRLALVAASEVVTLCEWDEESSDDHASRAMARGLAEHLERPIHHHDMRR